MLDTIFDRRSIRKYKDIPVKEEDLLTMIRAGVYAASARNLQPWQFITITSEKSLSYIAEVHPQAKMMQTAKAGIIVLGDKEKSPYYWPTDCAAATQNILLCAKELGYGTCWIGIHPYEERNAKFAGYFNIPDGFSIFSIIAIGVPDEEKERPERFFEYLVHKEKF